MKIGDKVRFLSETGGGIVKGFNGKNIALVEDEDGFEIPMPVNECVVITTNEYNIAKPQAPQKQEKKAGNQKSDGAKGSTKESEYGFRRDIIDIPDEEPDPADKPITFKPVVTERRGGDKLNVFIAFVPVNSRELSTTTFEAYIINDSNYFLAFTWLMAENASWHLKTTGIIDPNTKVFLEEFKHTDLNDMERMAIQFISYKEDKPFMLKPPVSVDLRIDGVKFFKLHAFKENEFFDENALIYDIVKDDVVSRPLVIDIEEVKRAMYGIERAREMVAPARTTSHEANSPSNMKNKVAKLQHEASAYERIRERGKHVIIEVDLHINELLDSTAGMSAGDMKDYQMDVFRKVMEAHKNEHGQRIVFIHGKGDGALRKAITEELRHKYKTCNFQDASFQEYGFGATMVIIH